MNLHLTCVAPLRRSGACSAASVCVAAAGRLAGHRSTGASAVRPRDGRARVRTCCFHLSTSSSVANVSRDTCTCHLLPASRRPTACCPLLTARDHTSLLLALLTTRLHPKLIKRLFTLRGDVCIANGEVEPVQDACEVVARSCCRSGACTRMTVQPSCGSGSICTRRLLERSAASASSSASLHVFMSRH